MFQSGKPAACIVRSLRQITDEPLIFEEPLQRVGDGAVDQTLVGLCAWSFDGVLRALAGIDLFKLEAVLDRRGDQHRFRPDDAFPKLLVEVLL